MSKLAILEFYRKALARLDVKIAALQVQYARAEAEILSNLLATLAVGRSVQLRERRQQEALAREILRAVDESTRLLVPQLIDQSSQIGARVADMGTNVKQPPGLSAVNRGAVKLLTENLIEDLGQATQTVGRLVQGVYRQEALRSSITNATGDRPVKQVSFQLEQALVGDGLTAFYDSIGRRWSLSNYSDMAVKTVTQEAVNRSQENLLRSRGIDIVEFNSVPDPCKDTCIRYDGETFSLTGRAKGYTVLEKDERAPFHGRCRHLMFASPLAMEERAKSGWAAPIEDVVEDLVGV